MDGDYSQVTKAAKQIFADIAISGGWSLAGIALVVILFFRRVRALMVVLVVLGLSTAWMMAFAQVAVGYLNLVTSIIFAILFGMGVDYVIHGMSRVDEEYHGDVPLEVALEKGMIGLARPVFNAMLENAVRLKQQADQDKANEAAQAKIEAQRKADEAKRLKDEENARKKAESATDKEKLEEMVKQIQAIVMPTCSSIQGDAIARGAIERLNKIVGHMHEAMNNM